MKANKMRSSLFVVGLFVTLFVGQYFYHPISAGGSNAEGMVDVNLNPQGLVPSDHR